MRKIYFVSPTHVATGGTELLQQACFYLKQFGANSYMYYTEEIKGSPVESRFSVYSNKVAEEIPDSEESVVVIPETRINYIHKFKNAKVYIWWLSVDNYYGSRRNKVDVLHQIVYKIWDFKNMSVFKKCDHLVQSEYAKLFLMNEKGISETRIKKLSDYLNHTYLDKAKKDIGMPRRKRILYNPKKGIEFTKELMEEINEYEWVALQGFTPEEMQMTMQTSKVYVDFGNHPGKDRIPREAAICGCCVITGMRGAAANNVDVLIDSKYKFEDKIECIEQIHKVVTECMENYETKTCDFEKYRDYIRNEENVFCEEIKRIFLGDR